MDTLTTLDLYAFRRDDVLGGRATWFGVRSRIRPKGELVIVVSVDRPFDSSNLGSPAVVNFRLPESVAELAMTLSVDESLLTRLIEPAAKQMLYRRHLIPRRRPRPGRTHRVVWEVENIDVAAVHKAVARQLQDFATASGRYPTRIAHGYVPGRSTLTNAQQHAGRHLLLRADIADFFATITAARSFETFTGLGLHPAVAQSLAEMCTVDDQLALGLHGSPLIANLVCTEMDKKLEDLATHTGAEVTRYADDITFSSDASLPSTGQVDIVLRSEGFEASPWKYRMTKRGQAHFVTGLSVSDTAPRIPRAMKKRVRQELYYAEKHGLLEHLGRCGDATHQAGVNRIDGMIKYVHAIEPKLAYKLKNQWQRVLAESSQEPSYASLAGSERHAVTFFFDETEIGTLDGRVLAIALVVVAEEERVRDVIRSEARNYLMDPHSTGDKERLADGVLHYADASEDLRTLVFKRLAFLPFRAFVAYATLPAEDEYEHVYLALVGSLLKHRLMACDGAAVSLVFEQNSKLTSRVNTLVDETFAKLAATNNRRPSNAPMVTFGSKELEPCLAVPDFLLASFRKYALLDQPEQPASGKRKREKREPGELDRKRFERLRDKTRLIRSLVTGEIFTRHKPFLPWRGGRPTEAARSR